MRQVSPRSGHSARRAACGLGLGAVVLAGCMSPVETQNPNTTPERQAEARRNLGMDHLAKGRTAMAVRELLAAVAVEPDDKETQLWLGEAYRRKGMLDDALEHMLYAIELDPAYHIARVNLSALYIQLERFDDAIRESRILIEDPTFSLPWRALTNQGWAEYRKGDLVGAEKTLRQAIDYYTDFWPAILNLAIVLDERGKKLEAIELLEEVLALDPGRSVQAETHFRLAEIFVALGRREHAIRHFSQVVDISPRGRWGKDSKRYLKLLR